MIGRQGKQYLYLVKYQDFQKLKHSNDNITNKALQHMHTTTTLESRLKAKICEM